MDDQNSKHITVTGSLEDKIHLLTLENEQLKKRLWLKAWNKRSVYSNLIHQDQELEDGRLQSSIMKDLKQKMRQLEAKKKQLYGKLTPDPIADTNLRDLVSMIHSCLDGSQPILARKLFGSLELPTKVVAMQMGQT
ncbi:hypothetical protein EDD22DRAFT_845770 [Suillus occidentalis]|nr:hypothetical protein EDD22DRAFT_845770 [Suillus occidentalis]